MNKVPVQIRCPECGKTCDAVEDLSTWPWATLIHECEHCGYIIMESEWERVKSDGEEESDE